MNPTPELTPTQRLESERHRNQTISGRPEVSVDFARTLAVELEQAQARVKELEETIGTSMSPISLKIRRLQKQYEETQIQLTKAMTDLAASESRAAVRREALQRCASIMQAGEIPERGLDEETHTSTQDEYWEALAAATRALEGGQP